MAKATEPGTATMGMDRDIPGAEKYPRNGADACSANNARVPEDGNIHPEPCPAKQTEHLASATSGSEGLISKAAFTLGGGAVQAVITVMAANIIAIFFGPALPAFIRSSSLPMLEGAIYGMVFVIAGGISALRRPAHAAARSGAAFLLFVAYDYAISGHSITGGAFNWADSSVAMLLPTLLVIFCLCVAAGWFAGNISDWGLRAFAIYEFNEFFESIGLSYRLTNHPPSRKETT